VNRGVLPALCVVAACTSGSAAEALEAAAPFREEHRRFADWAERTLGSEAGHPRSRAELQETLFAPLVLESGVLGARVERGERSWDHGEPIDPDLEWQVAREGDAEIRVATTESAVLIATERGRIRVLMAFRREPGDGS